MSSGPARSIANSSPRVRGNRPPSTSVIWIPTLTFFGSATRPTSRRQGASAVGHNLAADQGDDQVVRGGALHQGVGDSRRVSSATLRDEPSTGTLESTQKDYAVRVIGHTRDASSVLECGGRYLRWPVIDAVGFTSGDRSGVAVQPGSWLATGAGGVASTSGMATGPVVACGAARLGLGS